jgi:hypothetical protein
MIITMSGSGSAAAPDPGSGGQGRDGSAATDQQAAAPPASEAEQASPPQRDAPPIADPPPRVAVTGPSHDPHADFLITSADRDAAEARLRQAVVDEVLTLDQFGDRMRAVLEARTRGDLQEATAGVPLAAEPRRRTRERGTARPARPQQNIVAIMSEASTRGRWRPARETTALAVMGNAVVDLQGAEFEGDELKLNAIAWMGGVEIIVPEGVEVELSGFAIMGDRSMKLEGGVFPDAPLVRVDAYAVMGSVDIRHPKPKERFDPDDGRGAFADRVPLASADELSAVRRSKRSPVAAKVRQWVGGALAAAALLVPLAWAGSSDQVAPAIFGENQHVVATQSLEAGEELTVGAPVAFGSITIEVPEGVNVERNGVVIFGSTDCTACGAQADPDAPTVRVRTIGGFGSIEINPVTATGGG